MTPAPRCRSPVIQPKGKNHRLAPETEYAIELDMLRAMTEPRREWTKDKSWKFERLRGGGRSASPLRGGRSKGVPCSCTWSRRLQGKKYTHRLGAWEIKEAYSVAVGILHGGKPKTPSSAGFEYMVVDRILAHYFDDVTPLQCIALCHWALQDLAPANTLFSLIEMFEPHGKTLPPAGAIYDAARNEALDRGFEQNSRENRQVVAAKGQRLRCRR